MLRYYAKERNKAMENMKRAARIVGGIALAAACTTTTAQDNITREDFDRLKARIEALEKLVEAQQALLAERKSANGPHPQNRPAQPVRHPVPNGE